MVCNVMCCYHVIFTSVVHEYVAAVFTSVLHEYVAAVFTTVLHEYVAAKFTSVLHDSVATIHIIAEERTTRRSFSTKEISPRAPTCQSRSVGVR